MTKIHFLAWLAGSLTDDGTDALYQGQSFDVINASDGFVKLPAANKKPN